MRTVLRYRPNLRADKRLARKQFLSERSRLGVEARERLRVERTKDKPLRETLAGKHVYRIPLINMMTGVIHTLDFFVSAHRVNSWRVEVDGKAWRKQISMTRAMELLRRKMPPLHRHVD